MCLCATKQNAKKSLGELITFTIYYINATFCHAMKNYHLYHFSKWHEMKIVREGYSNKKWYLNFQKN